jgi:putative Holliday junction resolvase
MQNVVNNLSDFNDLLKPKYPLIGLDLGTKTIGISISDLLLKVANPLLTLKRKKLYIDLDVILNIISERSICGIVLGLPKNMNGSEGPRAQSTRSFGHNLSKVTNLPITFWDERLSTVAAEKALLEADTTRKRRAELIDSVAAAYILQGALDRLGYIRDQHDG